MLTVVQLLSQFQIRSSIFETFHISLHNTIIVDNVPPNANDKTDQVNDSENNGSITWDDVVAMEDAVRELEEVPVSASPPVIRVFKIEERGRLEERHGRRGPGSNIRCSRSSAAGKLS